MSSLPFGGVGAVYGDMYARGLGAALRAYRLYDLDYALQQDPEAYERMRRDPVIDFSLHYRKLLAAGDSWFLEVKPLDEKGRLLVRIFETLIKQIERFPSVRYNLAEAAVKGSAWGKIWGETRVLRVSEKLPALPWRVVTRVQDVDKRRLRQYPVELPPVDREILVENPAGLFAGSSTTTNMVLTDRQREWIWQIFRPLQQRWEEIDRNSFVRHVYQDREEALGYGSGLASTLYTFWWAKEQVLAHGLQFVERWAQGLVKVGLTTLRDGLATTPSAAVRQANWLNTFETMRTRHILVYDKEDELDVVDPPTDGWRVITEALAYLDGAIRVAVLGASLPTEQEVQGGSFAMAKVQQSATDAVVRFDRSLLEETLTRDVIGYLWDANFHHLARLGLVDRDPPSIKLRDHRDHDPQERIDTALKLLEAGCDVKREEIYSFTGFTPPAPEDDVVKARSLPVSVPGISLPRDEATTGVQGLEDGSQAPAAVGEGGTSVAEQRQPSEPAASGAEV